MPRKPKAPTVPIKQKVVKSVFSPLTHKPVGIIGGGDERRLFDPRSNFANSFQREITPEALKHIAKNVLFDKAIERISNGVAGISWVIDPPEELKDNKGAIANARKLTRSLNRPSIDIRHNTYRKFTKSAIKDLLVFGCAAVERQMGYKDDAQNFWLWTPNPEFLKLDPSWDGDPDQPHYWYCPFKNRIESCVPVLDENMFLIQSRISSYEVICPSPVKLAYDDINTWMGLHGYQARTVNNGVRDYMINLENAQEDEIEGFREYWRSNVVGLGEIPIIGGKVSVVKFGARNDEELFLKYTEILTGIIALYFGLSHRDVGNQREDSYATADVAQSHSFQDAILPIAQTLVDDLNNEVIDYYYPDYTLKIADTEPRKEIEEAQRAATLFQAGLVTRNESRRMLGEPPLEGGDVFFDGTKPGEAPLQPQPANNDLGTNVDKKTPQPKNSQNANINDKLPEVNGKVKTSQKLEVANKS